MQRMLPLLLQPSRCRQLKLQETRGLQGGRTIYTRTDCTSKTVANDSVGYRLALCPGGLFYECNSNCTHQALKLTSPDLTLAATERGWCTVCRNITDMMQLVGRGSLHVVDLARVMHCNCCCQTSACCYCTCHDLTDAIRHLQQTFLHITLYT